MLPSLTRLCIACAEPEEEEQQYTNTPIKRTYITTKALDMQDCFTKSIGKLTGLKVCLRLSHRTIVLTMSTCMSLLRNICSLPATGSVALYGAEYFCVVM